MKNQLLLLFAFFVSLTALAQSPDAVKYQAVLRNAGGEVLVNQSVGMRISVLQGSANGILVYEETHAATSNEFGLINLNMGNGTATVGDFGSINWGTNPHFVKIELDEANNGNYTELGTSELLSVPYALYAKNAGSDGDNNATNELQTLSFSNDTIFLSDGGEVSLSVYTETFFEIALALDTIHMYFDSVDVAFGEIEAELDTIYSDLDQAEILFGDIYLTLDTVDMYFDSVETHIFSIYNEIDTIYLGLGLVESELISIYSEIDTLYMGLDSAEVLFTQVFDELDLIYDGFDSVEVYLNYLYVQDSIALDNLDSLTSFTVDGFNEVVLAFDSVALAIEILDSQDSLLNSRIDSIIANDLDTDASNEIQSLSLSGDTLSISDGNNVVLSSPKWEEDTNGVYRMNGNVGIGKLPNSLDTKLEVLANRTATNNGIISRAVSSSGNGAPQYGIVGRAEGVAVNNIGSGIHVGVLGHTDAPSPNSWENIGVLGEANTQYSTARALSGRAYGANRGWGLFAEAITDSTNTGAAIHAISSTGNVSTQTALYAEARGNWDPNLGVGTGNHFGVWARASGINGFNIGLVSQAAGVGVNTNRGIEAQANSDSTGNNMGIIAFAQGNISGINYGAFGKAGNSSDNNTGVYGEVWTNGSARINFGVDGTVASTGETNIGVGGYAYGTNTGGNKNYGLYGYSQNADTNYAVYATSTGNNPVNYGIYAEASNATSNNYAGFFRGSVQILDGGFEKVSGETFFNTMGFRTPDFSKRVSIGMSSQAAYNNAFTIGVNNGSWKNPVIIDLAAPTDVFIIDSLGNISVSGNLSVTGTLSKGGGTFKIDHPLDPANKNLVHSFVESNEMMNVYSGNITTDANGFATVVMPEYFEAANKDYRYQLTVIGSFAQAIVKEEISNNTFVVQTSNPNVKVSWQVTAVRDDKWANEYRINDVEYKTQKGKYLHPELYGVTQEKKASVQETNDYTPVPKGKSQSEKVMNLKLEQSKNRPQPTTPSR